MKGKQIRNPKVTYKECRYCGVDNVEVPFTMHLNTCNDCRQMETVGKKLDYVNRVKKGGPIKKVGRPRVKKRYQKEKENKDDGDQSSKSDEG